MKLNPLFSLRRDTLREGAVTAGFCFGRRMPVNKDGVSLVDFIRGLLKILNVPENSVRLDKIEHLYWSEILDESERLSMPGQKGSVSARSALSILGVVAALEAFANQELVGEISTDDIVRAGKQIKAFGPSRRIEQKLNKLLPEKGRDAAMRDNLDFLKKLIRVRSFWAHYPGIPVYVDDATDRSQTGFEKILGNKETLDMMKYLTSEYAMKACREVRRFIGFVESSRARQSVSETFDRNRDELA